MRLVRLVRVCVGKSPLRPPISLQRQDRTDQNLLHPPFYVFHSHFYFQFCVFLLFATCQLLEDHVATPRELGPIAVQLAFEYGRYRIAFDLIAFSRAL